MPILQKFCSQVLVAALAFGGMTCPCPAQAGSEAASHARQQSPQHEHGQAAGDHATAGGYIVSGGHVDTSHAAAGHGGDRHSDCQPDCSQLSAMSSHQKEAGSGAAKLKFDDSAAFVPETISLPRLAPSVARIGPPSRHWWLSPDTPVRRHDRLLD